MALANYTDLQASIAAWLWRTDLTSVIPDYITLAEGQMNRFLRVRPMIVRSEATLAASTEFITVPSDLLEPIQLTIEITESDIRFLEYLAPERLLLEKVGVTSEAEPTFYTIVGGSIQFLPIPEQAYTVEFTYYGAIPALASNSTNWLLTAYPDAYLYGSLMQAAPYLKDDHRITTWAALYERALADIKKSYRVPPGKLRTEIPNIIRSNARYNITTDI